MTHCIYQGCTSTICADEFWPFCSEECRRRAMGKEVIKLHTPDKPMKCRNPNCGHDVANDSDYCTEECARSCGIPGKGSVSADAQLLSDAAHGGGFGDEKQKADQKLIAQEVIAWGALALRKNADYGSSVWKEPCLAPSMESDSAIKVRMSDKIERIINLEGSDQDYHINESLDDTYRDLGIYCLLKIINPNKK